REKQQLGLAAALVGPGLPGPAIELAVVGGVEVPAVEALADHRDQSGVELMDEGPLAGIAAAQPFAADRDELLGAAALAVETEEPVAAALEHARAARVELDLVALLVLVLVPGDDREPAGTLGRDRVGLVAAVVDAVGPVGQLAIGQVADVDVEARSLLVETFEHLAHDSGEVGVVGDNAVEVVLGADARVAGADHVEVDLADGVARDEV